MKRCVTFPILMVLFLVIIGASCTPAAEITPQPKIEKTVPISGKAAWEEVWDKTLAEARKEGPVLVYTALGPEARVELTKGFKEKLDFSLEFFTGQGPEIVKRVTAEQQAGLNLVDAFITGVSTPLTMLKPLGVLDPIEPLLILPEVKDVRLWRENRLPFIDEDKKVVAFIASNIKYIGINTELVKEGQIKSYYDVLKPEWKGHIAMGDPTLTGPTNTWLTFMARLMDYDLTRIKEFLKQLANQEPVIIRDRRLLVEWIARGKYKVALGPHMETMAEFMAAGAPLSLSRLAEGSLVAPATGGLCVPAKPGHPKGSKVFVNWLLSQEGQTAFVKGFGNPSARLDVATAGINPVFLSAPSEKTYAQDEKHVLFGDRMIELSKEAFSRLLK